MSDTVNLPLAVGSRAEIQERRKKAHHNGKYDETTSIDCSLGAVGELACEHAFVDRAVGVVVIHREESSGNSEPYA